MKRLGIAVIMVFLLLSTNGWATYTGSIKGGETLFGTGSWDDAVLKWEVSSDNDVWTYNYVFTVSDKAISHLIFEVSETFTAENILEGTTVGYELELYDEGDGNPGMLGSMFGLKWNLDTETTSATVTIVTDRAPMWGDFYAKDGVEKVDGEKTSIYAYNTAFGTDSLEAVGYGNGNGWVMVPDTTSSAPVPEPGTIILMASGLFAIAGVGRRRKRK